MPRIVTCPDHNLKYDAERSDGCVLCKRNRPEPPSPGLGEVRAPSAKLIGGALALVMVLAAGWFFLTLTREAPSVDIGNAPMGRGSLDPAPFRQSVQDIEDIIYSEEPPGYEDPLNLEKLGMDLHQDLLDGGHRAEAVAVLAWAASMGGESDVGMGMVAPTVRKRWIADWEALAADVFQPSDWIWAFQAAREAPSGADFAQSLSGLLDDIEQEVDDLRPYTGRFGELPVNLNNIDEGDNEGRLSEYRFWMEGVQQDADRLAARLPGPADVPRDDPELGYAYDNVEFALRRLKQPPNPGSGIFHAADDPALNALYLPSSHQLEDWVKDLDRIIAQAREQLR